MLVREGASLVWGSSHLGLDPRFVSTPAPQIRQQHHVVLVVLVRLVGRWAARVHPEPLKPALGADLATLLVGMGTFLIGLSIGVAFLDPSTLDATNLAALKAPMLANAAAMSPPLPSLFANT